METGAGKIHDHPNVMEVLHGGDLHFAGSRHLTGHAVKRTARCRSPRRSRPRTGCWHTRADRTRSLIWASRPLGATRGDHNSLKGGEGRLIWRVPVIQFVPQRSPWLQEAETSDLDDPLSRRRKSRRGRQNQRPETSDPLRQ